MVIWFFPFLYLPRVESIAYGNTPLGQSRLRDEVAPRLIIPSLSRLSPSLRAKRWRAVKIISPSNRSGFETPAFSKKKKIIIIITERIFI